MGPSAKSGDRPQPGTSSVERTPWPRKRPDGSRAVQAAVAMVPNCRGRACEPEFPRPFTSHWHFGVDCERHMTRAQLEAASAVPASNSPLSSRRAPAILRGRGTRRTAIANCQRTNCQSTNATVRCVDFNPRDESFYPARRQMRGSPSVRDLIRGEASSHSPP